MQFGGLRRQSVADLGRQRSEQIGVSECIRRRWEGIERFEQETTGRNVGQQVLDGSVRWVAGGECRGAGVASLATRHPPPASRFAAEQATQAVQVMLAQLSAVGYRPAEVAVPGVSRPLFRSCHQRRGQSSDILTRSAGRPDALAQHFPDAQRQLLRVASQHLQMIAASAIHHGRPSRQGPIEFVELAIELIEQPRYAGRDIRVRRRCAISSARYPGFDLTRCSGTDKAGAVFRLQQARHHGREYGRS